MTYDELQSLCARLTERNVRLDDRARMLEAQHSAVMATTAALRHESRELHRLLLREAIAHQQAGRKDRARQLTDALAEIRAGAVPAPTPIGA